MAHAPDLTWRVVVHAFYLPPIPRHVITADAGDTVTLVQNGPTSDELGDLIPNTFTTMASTYTHWDKVPGYAALRLDASTIPPDLTAATDPTAVALCTWCLANDYVIGHTLIANDAFGWDVFNVYKGNATGGYVQVGYPDVFKNDDSQDDIFGLAIEGAAAFATGGASLGYSAGASAYALGESFSTDNAAGVAAALASLGAADIDDLTADTMFEGSGDALKTVTKAIASLPKTNPATTVKVAVSSLTTNPTDGSPVAVIERTETGFPWGIVLIVALGAAIVFLDT